jgi:hypothetical protein
VTDPLATAVIVLSLALGGWALLWAGLDRLLPKAHLQALFLLQAALVVQAVIALVRMGDWGGSKGELSGYLAVSALLCRVASCSPSRSGSRYGTLVLPSPASRSPSSRCAC